jgi:UDP-N-acetylmuramoylalanine--D-glutamate ligase
MDASAYFRGKKVTVMGLGLLGRGLGDTLYLARNGAELIVTDPKSVQVLAPSIEALKEFPNITFTIGEHRLEDFRGRDLILKAAGVPKDSPYLLEAAKEGMGEGSDRTLIKMSASLFAEIAQIPIVGVTGTRGKSTVTHMIAAIYREAGKEILLGGNVRGVSTLALLDEVTSGQTGIFELDSWQLQGFGDAKISPSIAVFTTFYPDHLNYYHGDLDAYLSDKANIFLYQNPEDTLVLGTQCMNVIKEKYGEKIKSRIVTVGIEDFPDEWELQIPGEHNRYNAALALAAARVAGIEDSVSKKALGSFKGLEGRLYLIGTIDGVKIYNDSNSTTPEATITALQALSSESSIPAQKRVILIMGGADKALEMKNLVQEIHTYVKRLIFLAGTGTEGIRPGFPEAEVFENLAMAFADARAHADSGDVILFSPAFASFGMFTNEYDRGDQFTALVQQVMATS